MTGRESATIIRGRHKIVSLHDGVGKEETHVHAGRVPEEENIVSSGAKLLRRLVCKSTENISHNVVIILVEQTFGGIFC